LSLVLRRTCSHALLTYSSFYLQTYIILLTSKHYSEYGILQYDLCILNVHNSQQLIGDLIIIVARWRGIWIAGAPFFKRFWRLGRPARILLTQKSGVSASTFRPCRSDPQSKEFKVMVMVDIFWYLTLVVGSELPLLVKQSVHNCTWIEHGSGPGIAYYRFNNLTRLKYCWIRCRLAVLGLRMVLVPGSTFTSLENSLTTLTNLGKNYTLFRLSLSPIYRRT
jgi:hypothetical protein